MLKGNHPYVIINSLQQMLTCFVFKLEKIFFFFFFFKGKQIQWTEYGGDWDSSDEAKTQPKVVGINMSFLRNTGQIQW